MVPLWSFLLGSPLKLTIWFGHRIATGTGLFFVWRKLKGAPDRTKRFLVWLLVINVISFLTLVAILWWVQIHKVG